MIRSGESDLMVKADGSDLGSSPDRVEPSKEGAKAENTIINMLAVVADQLKNNSGVLNQDQLEALAEQVIIINRQISDALSTNKDEVIPEAVIQDQDANSEKVTDFENAFDFQDAISNEFKIIMEAATNDGSFDLAKIRQILEAGKFFFILDVQNNRTETATSMQAFLFALGKFEGSISAEQFSKLKQEALVLINETMPQYVVSHFKDRTFAFRDSNNDAKKMTFAEFFQS